METGEELMINRAGFFKLLVGAPIATVVVNTKEFEVSEPELLPQTSLLLAYDNKHYQGKYIRINGTWHFYPDNFATQSSFNYTINYSEIV